MNSIAANAAVAPRAGNVDAVKGWKVTTSRGESKMDLSSQWFARPHDERFVSLDELHAKMKARRDETAEHVLDVRNFEINSPSIEPGDDYKTANAKAKTLLLGIDKGERAGDEIAMTHWTFGQLSALAKAPAQYLRTLPGQIVGDAMSYGLRYNRSREEVKLFADEIEAMAITGPDYGRIFNVEVVEAVQQIAGDGVGSSLWRVPGVMDWSTMIYTPASHITKENTTIFGNDRGVFIFLVDDRHPIEIGKLPDGSPDLVFRGFYITNSEVGAGALKIAAFYLRAICCNRIMWGVEGFQEMTMRHTKYAPTRFVEEARPALESFAQGSGIALVEGVKQAKSTVIANDKAEALLWLNDRGFSRKRSMAIFDRIVQEERRNDKADRPVSAWEIAQGITAEARVVPNADDRIDMEFAAKKVLDRIVRA